MRGAANRTLWLAVALAYSVSACTSVRALPVTQTTSGAHVTVQSGVAFAVHGSDTLTCASYRASGTVDSLRGDTVQLRDISVLSIRAGEPPACEALRAGWLVIAGEPAPEILGRRVRTGVKVGGILVAAGLFFIVTAVGAAFGS